MDDKYKKIIREEIAPLLQRGDLALFLGAGVSIGTPNINGMGVPSTPELITRICDKAGYSDDAETADLPTAFGAGEDEIDNFTNFIVSNFEVTTPYAWQKAIFKHWWRIIFTTNIDTIPDISIKDLKKSILLGVQGETLPAGRRLGR